MPDRFSGCIHQPGSAIHRRGYPLSGKRSSPPLRPVRIRGVAPREPGDFHSPDPVLPLITGRRGRRTV